MSARGIKDQKNKLSSGTLESSAPINKPSATIAALKLFLIIFVSAGIATGSVVFLIPLFKTQQPEVESLIQTVNQLKKRLENLDHQQQQVSLPNSKVSDADTVLPLVEKIDERVSAIEKKINDAPQKNSERPKRIEQVYTRLQALANLKEALKSSQPFLKELDAVLAGITPVRQDDEAIFKTLRETAAVGAPTLATLEKSFRNDLLPLLQPTPTAFIERWKHYLLETIQSLIIINPGSPPSSSQPWLTTLQETLKQGHLEQVLSLLEDHASVQNQALLDWKKNVEKRLFIDKHYYFLKAYTLDYILNSEGSESPHHNTTTPAQEDIQP